MSLGLDLNGVAEQGAPIPAGRYSAVVEKAEVTPTKSGGEMIKIQLKVLEQGPFFGRSIFDNFNIRNANPQAVQIGLGQLKGFMRAAGHPNPNRLETVTELMGLKAVVITKIDNDPQYGEQTRVKGYSSVTPALGQAIDRPSQVQTQANPFA
jgi:hypothetical protein